MRLNDITELTKNERHDRAALNELIAQAIKLLSPSFKDGCSLHLSPDYRSASIIDTTGTIIVIDNSDIRHLLSEYQAFLIATLGTPF